MGSYEIDNELLSLGVSNLLSDSANGVLNWAGYGAFNVFSNVVAIRTNADWEISAIAHGPRSHTLELSITINERLNSGQLSVGLAVWKFSLIDSNVKVINSASTDELLIKFMKNTRSVEHREPVVMNAGSYILIRDTNKHLE